MVMKLRSDKNNKMIATAIRNLGATAIESDCFWDKARFLINFHRYLPNIVRDCSDTDKVLNLLDTLSRKISDYKIDSLYLSRRRKIIMMRILKKLEMSSMKYKRVYRKEV